MSDTSDELPTIDEAKDWLRALADCQGDAAAVLAYVERLERALDRIQRDGHWLGPYSVGKIITCARQNIDLDDFYKPPTQ